MSVSEGLEGTYSESGVAGPGFVWGGVLPGRAPFVIKPPKLCSRGNLLQSEMLIKLFGDVN